MSMASDYDHDSDQEPHSVTCKRCGKAGLHWQDEDGEWVLMEGRYKVHHCDMRKAAAGDFEAVQ